MAFLETRFPTAISYGSTGGPERRTEVVTLGSGREERNSPWKNSRRKYNAQNGIRKHVDLFPVLELFEVAAGRLHGFRFLDPFDFKSSAPAASISATDQTIGSGDGSAVDFQLTKTYRRGGQTYARTILKPVPATVRIAVAGVEKTYGTDFSVNHVDGSVRFVAAPASGAAIAAGFEFDVPVRFDVDDLQLSLDTIEASSIPNIPLIELVALKATDTVPLLLKAATTTGPGATTAFPLGPAYIWTWGTFAGASAIFEESDDGTLWTTLATHAFQKAELVTVAKPFIRARVASAAGGTSINADASAP